MRTPLRLLFTLISIAILTTGCSSTYFNTSNQPKINVDAEKRSALLSQLTSWQVNGKIAFITPKERNSASLYWKKSIDSQKLNLTTFLGINVLQLTSKNNVHIVELDGEEYTDVNLDNLITSLTDLTLPTEALTYWIKALPYLPADIIELNDNNLPKSLTSFYNNREWAINYSHYKATQLLTNKTNVQLPHRIKVKSQDLTINIVINQWKI